MELLLAERVTHDMAYLMLRDNLDGTSDPLTRLNLSLDRHFLCCVIVHQAHDKPQIEAHTAAFLPNVARIPSIFYDGQKRCKIVNTLVKIANLSFNCWIFNLTLWFWISASAFPSKI